MNSLTETTTDEPLTLKPEELNENIRSDANLNLRDGLQQYKKVAHWTIALSSVVCLWGYDLAVVGAVASLDPFQRDFGVFDKIENGKEKWIIPGIWLSLWLAMPSVGQLVGGIVAGPLADRRGRKACMLWGAILITVAVLIIFLANRVPGLDGKRGVFLAGKMLQGIATALLKITTQTWISETAPVCLRGALMTVVPAANLVGQLIGALAVFGVNGIETDFGYLLVLGLQWVFCIAPFLLAFILPESPAYLVRQDRLGEARQSIDRLFAPKNDSEKVLADVVAAEQEERSKHMNAGAITYAECFRGTNLPRTGVVIFANFLPPLFGLPLLTSASYFLQQLGMTSRFSLIFLIIGIIVGFAGNLGSTWTLSHLSRRWLTIYSLLGTAALWAAMGVTGVIPSAAAPEGISKWLAAAFMMLIIFVCGLGCWSSSYTIMSEVSSLRLRAASQSIGGISAYLAAIFTNFVLPFLYNPDQADLKATTGFVFTGTSVIAAVATWAVVPEMRGRSVMEIDHMFESGVKAWRSAAWVDEKGGAGATV
ncbi:MFS general substrate transporter [Periconia macrospinosa]|uniref:MFS general substrate transporter n=1 Tax=Periconia macrospinosa TaxID=97972 RepID=A0A2V1DH97_9PLEO|nr:MFS general substrate transporter [Periconia macrospinosa]